MKELIWTEQQKLHRSKIVWIVVFSVIMVSAIVFAQGQFTYNGIRYVDRIGWFLTAAQSLATLYVFPAIISLFGSYMICREEQEDTMKSLRLVPVNEIKLTVSKMIITMIFSVFVYVLLFIITLFAEAILHIDELSIQMVMKFFKIYFVNGIGVFFAVSPIIALVARIKKGYWLALIFAEIYSFAGLFVNESLRAIYPITGIFQLSGYYESTAGNRLTSIFVLFLCAVLSISILVGLNKRESCDAVRRKRNC